MKPPRAHARCVLHLFGGIHRSTRLRQGYGGSALRIHPWAYAHGLLRRRIKLIAIVGPTASGKSELAVKIAKRFNGEIISADSRQIYRGLNIGTGKVKGKWISPNVPTSKRPLASWNIYTKRIFIYKNVPHYCIDLVSPENIFTAAEYKKCAAQALRDVISRRKIPILVGGTGFWIDAVVYGFDFPNIAPNEKLRRQLAKKPTEELFKILQRLDSERAKIIDSKNPRRLIRAIEIAKTLGRVPEIKKRSPYQVLWIGIKPPPEELRSRIHKRLIGRIRQGMISEARQLHKHGLPWQRFYKLGLEYRFLADHLRQKLTREEFVHQLEGAIRSYSKRQMTWFKRNRKIHWIKNKSEAIRFVKQFL